MKRLILVALLCLSTSVFAEVNFGVKVQAPIGDSVVDIGFRSDDHRYDRRYKDFNYKRYGYYDDYGYYFGYFDRTGYFFNNIFFVYNSKYTYYDRLHRKGYFRPNHIHFRKYVYTKGNNWNKEHKYRKNDEKIYGPYYYKHPTNNRYYKNEEYNHKKQHKGR